MTLATFGTGCFWCAQPPFEKLTGIRKVTVGYTGGTVDKPSYEDVGSGRTGHREAVQVEYDPNEVSYEALLDVFWRNVDPTDPGGQFFDRGSQYKTAIFYHDDEQYKLAEKSKQDLASSDKFDKPIVTEILPASAFYAAEDYHQAYYKKNPVHYMMYKKGSGRESFFKEVWGNEAR